MTMIKPGRQAHSGLDGGAAYTGSPGGRPPPGFKKSSPAHCHQFHHNHFIAQLDHQVVRLVTMLGLPMIFVSLCLIKTELLFYGILVLELVSKPPQIVIKPQLIRL